MRATGCDRLGNRSLSHTRRHLEKQAITQIKCQADKRELTGRVKTCGFIYGHKTDFLTPSAGGKKKSSSSSFFSLKVIILLANNLALKEQCEGLSHTYLSA